MPQASKKLRSEFPNGSSQAFDVLGNNFLDDKGILRRKDKTILPSDKQFLAIDYLCDEWDYCWEGLSKEELKIVKEKK